MGSRTFWSVPSTEFPRIVMNKAFKECLLKVGDESTITVFTHKRL